jgi:hypothetical protein
MIRPLKVVIIGGALGLAAGVLSAVVEFAILSARAYAEMQHDDAGGLGAVSAPLYAPYVALIGFIVGAVWQFRRSSATRRKK